MIDGKKVIALCLPGDHFSSAYVANLIGLYSQLAARYVVVPFMGYSSAVYVTRQCMAAEILSNKLAVDYALWIDDDNLLTFEQAEELIADLEYLRKEAQTDKVGVAAWCWIQADVHGEVLGPSCGRLDQQRMAHPLSERLLSTERIIPIDYTGFPAVLMTREVLEAAGPQGFVPIAHPASTWGALGEDVSFCVRTSEKGTRWFVDTAIQIPHLKLRAVNGPQLKKEAAA
jgi:hypothetical protein